MIPSSRESKIMMTEVDWWLPTAAGWGLQGKTHKKGHGEAI